MRESRLVAVLGYPNGAGAALHPVCETRLRRAAQEAGEDDVVLLTGRARRRPQVSEAELMARSWNGRSRSLVLDPCARSTLANTLVAARTARELQARHVVLVTSGWHGRRALALLRAVLRGSDIRISLAATDERGSLRDRLRELGCWTLVPVQAMLAARMR